MRRFAFACFTSLVALAAAQSAESPHATNDLAANAALQYWQAFSQLPAMNAEREKIVAAWNTVSLDDPAVQKLIVESQNSLLYLRRAGQLSRCDWGLDYSDGISMLMPFLAKGRDLARLAALNARQEFERGNRKMARTDATAIMTLARHVGREPVMICVLVRYGIEGMAVDLVAPYVTEIKASHAEAAAQFSNLPTAPALVQTIPAEKEFFIEWMATRLKTEEQRQVGAGLALWKNLLSAPEMPEGVRKVGSVAEAVQRIESVLPIYDELAKLVALPKEQFDAQYPAFKQKTKAANPLAGSLLPSVDEILAKEQRNTARAAMLLAAIAVSEGGPERLKELKDPFGTGPFEYRASENGFELKSRLLFEGQPVTLVAGKTPQP